MNKWKKNLIWGYILVITGIIFVIIWFIIFPILFSNIPYYSFSGFILIIFGIIEIRYVLVNKDKADKYFLPPLMGMILTEKKIKKWVRQNVWEGFGTQPNPYKIIDPNKLPDNARITIKNTNSFFKIESCHFKNLKLEWCSNVIVNNCRIPITNLSYCTNIVITNNSIVHLGLTQSSGNFINNNEISKDWISELDNKHLSYPLYDTIEVIVITAIFYLIFNILSLVFRASFGWFMFLNLVMIIVPIATAFGKNKLISKLKFYNQVKNKPNIITEHKALTHLNF